MGSGILEIIILLLLLVVNGVFAMTEMAVVSARKGKLRQLAGKGNAGARAALALAETPNRFLPTVQIGITLVGLLAGAFGGATLAEQIAASLQRWPELSPYAEAIGVGVVVVILTFLSLVIGELVPKRLALSNPEAFASLMARPLDWLSRLARPAIWLLGIATDAILFVLRVKPRGQEPVSEEEVTLLMQEGTHAGIFHPNEPRMVASVLSFDQRPVTDIMTPRGKVIFLRRDEKHDALWHKIVVSGHSSFPVYEGSRDHISGVVSVKSIYANLAAGVGVQVADLMVQPLFVPITQTVTTLLETFKRTGKHIAVVMDERDRFVGLVTLVDVLEAIVGEIPSLEERLKPEARRREDGSWLVDGRFNLAKLSQLLNGEGERETPATPKQTVAGFVSSRLGPNAQEGAALDFEGWRIEVLDRDDDRIDKLLVTRAASKP
jgi:putative hemolysin